MSATLQPLAELAEHVLARDEHVVERQPAGRRAADAHLFHPLLDDLKAGHVGRDEKRGDLASSPSGRRRAGHHGQHLGDAAVGDPALLAVEHEAAAVGRRRGGRLHVRRIAAGFGLGQGKGADPLAARQLRQPLLLLLVGAKQDDRPRADRVMRIDEQRRAAAVSAEHFQQPAVGGLRQLQPAARFRQARAEHAELAQAGDHRLRNFRLAIDGDRIDVLGAEPTKFFHTGGDGFVVADRGIGRQLVGEVLAKHQPLHEAELLAAVAEKFLGLGNLLLALGRGHRAKLRLERSSVVTRSRTAHPKIQLEMAALATASYASDGRAARGETGGHDRTGKRFPSRSIDIQELVAVENCAAEDRQAVARDDCLGGRLLRGIGIALIGKLEGAADLSFGPLTGIGLDAGGEEIGLLGDERAVEQVEGLQRRGAAARGGGRSGRRRGNRTRRTCRPGACGSSSCRSSAENRPGRTIASGYRLGRSCRSARTAGSPARPSVRSSLPLAASIASRSGSASRRRGG